MPNKYSVSVVDPDHFDSPGALRGKGIHWLWGSLMLVNTLIGAGMLNMPYIIAESGGFLYAVPMQLLLAGSLLFAIAGIAWIADHKRQNYYQDVIREVLGAWGQYIVAVLIVITYFGACASFIVALSQQLTIAIGIFSSNNITNATTGDPIPDADLPIFMQRWLVSLVCVLVIIYPLCLVRHIDKLKYASTVATGFIFFVIGVVIYQFTQYDHQPIPTAPKKATDVLFGIPTIAFGYMMDIVAISVYSRMKNRSLPNFFKSIGFALLLAAVIYNGVSVIVLMTFGEDVPNDFMAGYTDQSTLIGVTQLVYSIKLCLEFPLIQFQGWAALRTLLKLINDSRFHEMLEKSEKLEGRFDWPRIIVSSLWVLISWAIGAFVPDLNYVLGLTGVFILQFQYTLPGVCLFIVAWKWQSELQWNNTKRYGMYAFSVYCIVLGTVLSAITLVQYIQQLISGDL